MSAQTIEQATGHAGRGEDPRVTAVRAAGRYSSIRFWTFDAAGRCVPYSGEGPTGRAADRRRRLRLAEAGFDAPSGRRLRLARAEATS